MSNFSYYTPTHVYFGKDTHKQVGDLVRAQGCKKVLIHFGGQSARRSGLLDQIERGERRACPAWRRRPQPASLPRLSGHRPVQKGRR